MNKELLILSLRNAIKDWEWLTINGGSYARGYCEALKDILSDAERGYYDE